ncbi:MAG: hypothetical protein KTR31_37195 [Myxococcales bacterium]|nr:hypothetical protein [Myxococcales bacterium]
MLFRHYGYDVDQAAIVEQAYGGPINMPAQPWTILSALNRSWTDRTGRRFRSVAQAGVTDPARAAQDLAGGMPLIIGTLGHAVVLTAMSYAFPLVRDAWGRPALGPAQVTQAVVRDPWPSKGRRVLSAREWYSISFVARVRVA